MKANEKLPMKAKITFGKFQNVDMRVGRITAAPLAEGTESPCRVLTIDAGHLGTFTSVGQYALLAEPDLIGRNVVICCNLSPREMGKYVSEVLLMGAPHPDSPEGQSQALPLFVDQRAVPGDAIF